MDAHREVAEASASSSSNTLSHAINEARDEQQDGRRNARSHGNESVQESESSLDGIGRTHTDSPAGDRPAENLDSTTSRSLQPQQDNATAAQEEHSNADASAPPQRSGATGFAALVDAFVSNFRHAMAGQRGDGEVPSQDQQQEAAHARAALATAARDSFTTGGQETASHGQNQENSNGEQVSSNTDDAQQGTTNEHPSRPHMILFRMPLVDAQGNAATIGFMPGPIPVAQDGASQPEHGPERPAHLGADRGNGRASGYHLPESPIFVPLGTSPLPFSFLFDSQTNTAWPILNVTHDLPGSMPPEAQNQERPRFVTAPPFRIALNFHFVPPPVQEQPDPERAKRFVASLERADAELRSRLARLGMGDIGGGETGQDAVGCGICLEEYPTEDRPEWIGGQASIDEEVVAVPCGGHHTLHHSCLYGWLEKTPPSQWTCPFCREKLDKEKVNSSASSERHTPPTQQQHQDSNNNGAATARTTSSPQPSKTQSEALKSRTLREEVRFRERACGWRCDSPACLPRYPGMAPVQSTEETVGAAAVLDTNEMVTLLPCHHMIHVDCLCTSMKLEQAETGNESQVNADDVFDDEEEDDAQWTEGAKDSAAAPRKLSANRQTVGKWVTCPTCRHEAWAELPVRRRPKRNNSKASAGISEESFHIFASKEEKDDARSAASNPTVAAEGLGSLLGPRQQARIRDLQADEAPSSKAQKSIDGTALSTSSSGRSSPAPRHSEESTSARSAADVEAMLS